METFVVRLWLAAEPEAPAQEQELRGQVAHVGSGRSARFVGGDALLKFLRSVRETATGERTAGDGPSTAGGSAGP